MYPPEIIPTSTLYGIMMMQYQFQGFRIFGEFMVQVGLDGEPCGFANQAKQSCKSPAGAEILKLTLHYNNLINGGGVYDFGRHIGRSPHIWRYVSIMNVA